MSFDGYLTQDEINRLASVANATEPLSNQMQSYLLDPLPSRFKGNFSIPQIAAIPQTRMVANKLNNIRSLDNGQIPIEAYVSQVAQINADAEHAGFLEGLLEKISAPVAIDNIAIDADSVNRAPVTPDLLREAIIGGRDETQNVAFLKQGLQAAGSVFKVLITRHFGGTPQEMNGEPVRSAGTGWVIAEGLGITNYHVIEARQKSLGETAAEDGDFAQQFKTAILHHELAELDATIGDKRILHADAKLDFVLFEMPDSMAQLAPISVRKLPLKKGPTHPFLQRVNVLQHPGGGSLKLAIRNNFVVRGTDTVLTYLSDTEQGSSGGAVCDDKWQARALHVGSRAVPEGPIKALDTIITKENVGLPVAAVLNAVAADDADLGSRLGQDWT